MKAKKKKKPAVSEIVTSVPGIYDGGAEVITRKTLRRRSCFYRFCLSGSDLLQLGWF